MKFKKEYLDILHNILLPSVIFIGVVFLLVNVMLSQAVSPLYFNLVNDEPQAIISYLKKIKNLPQFQQELISFNNRFGHNFEEEVFQEDRDRQKMIEELEQTLTLNPKARDVLYGLYLLYNEKGDYGQARDYLMRAREIDPNIQN